MKIANFQKVTALPSLLFTACLLPALMYKDLHSSSIQVTQEHFPTVHSTHHSIKLLTHQHRCINNSNPTQAAYQEPSPRTGRRWLRLQQSRRWLASHATFASKKVYPWPARVKTISSDTLKIFITPTRNGSVPFPSVAWFLTGKAHSKHTQSPSTKTTASNPLLAKYPCVSKSFLHVGSKHACKSLNLRPTAAALPSSKSTLATSSNTTMKASAADNGHTLDACATSSARVLCAARGLLWKRVRVYIKPCNGIRKHPTFYARS